MLNGEATRGIKARQKKILKNIDKSASKTTPSRNNSDPQPKAQHRQVTRRSNKQTKHEREIHAPRQVDLNRLRAEQTRRRNGESEMSLV